MAGYPISKEIADQTVGNLVTTLRDAFLRVGVISDWLGITTDQQLQNLGYTQPDIEVLREAFASLGKLAKIAHAEDVQAVPNDFFFWAKRLSGLS